MKPILEYIISKSSKRYVIKATDDNIRQVIMDELDRLGHNVDLNHIDTSKVRYMTAAFSCDGQNLPTKYKNLNPDISLWNTSNVEDMQFMFNMCENFNCDISNWDISKVINMKCMFFGCKSLFQDLSKWHIDIKNTEIRGMFDGCTKMPTRYMPF